MKKRNGFVTNSSSTNEIFQAVGTAGLATALGVIINTMQPTETSEIITYALLESYHFPEEPKPPVIRVNDSDYVAWYYAAIRIIEIQRTLDEKTRSYTVETLRDELDSSFTSAITFTIHDDIRRWLTFGASDTGSMEGDYKAIGFMCESPYNDRPRQMRQKPVSTIRFKISAICNGYEISTVKECTLRDEAALYASHGYALNDKSIVTKIPIVIDNKDKYSWTLTHEVLGEKLSEYCDLELRKDESIPPENPSVLYHLEVTPKGTKITSEENNSNRIISRIDFTGKPSSSHIADVWDYMELSLIDEGLFFEGNSDDQGHLIIKSFISETDESDDAEREIPSTSFKLNCVVKVESDTSDSTATFIDMSKATVTFEDMIGTDSSTDNLVKVFSYELEPDGTSGKYSFIPKLQLPSSNLPYSVKLPVKCVYEGDTYHMDLPIHLYGEPFGSKQAWEEEYKKLRIIIRKYVPAEQWSDILTQANSYKDRLSVEQLRLMRRSIWETARDSLTKEAAGYEQIATICEWTEWGLEGVKWLGDQAFSYLMTIWTGPLAEMFITPFKDVMLKLIGEIGADLIWTGKVMMSNEDIAKTSLSGIFGGFENLISDGADSIFDINKLSVKQMGRYLAAFAAVKCMNHYYCDTKADGTPVGIWDAIIDTCKDLTSTFFKALVVNQLNKLVKSPKAQELFEKYATKSVRAYLSSVISDWDAMDEAGERSITILVKYLSEFGGFLSLKAYGKVVDVAGTGNITTTSEDLILTFDLSSDSGKPMIVQFSLNRAKDAIFDYVFNNLFGSFPFSTNVITVPEDPTYFKS